MLVKTVIDNTLTLTLNRPERRNALNQEVRDGLLAALSESKSSEYHALIITGSGTAFCAGADTGENIVCQAQMVMDQYVDIISAIRSSHLITIAAVNGVAAGIGCALVTACDVAFMVPEAKLNLHFNKLGLIADGGLHWELVRALGYKRAFALLTEGGELSSQECYRAGIISALIPAEDLLAYAQDKARNIASDPVQAQLTKHCLKHAQTHSPEENLHLEARLQMQAFFRQ